MRAIYDCSGRKSKKRTLSPRCRAGPAVQLRAGCGQSAAEPLVSREPARKDATAGRCGSTAPGWKHALARPEGPPPAVFWVRVSRDSPFVRGMYPDAPHGRQGVRSSRLSRGGTGRACGPPRGGASPARAGRAARAAARSHSDPAPEYAVRQDGAAVEGQSGVARPIEARMSDLPRPWHARRAPGRDREIAAVIRAAAVRGSMFGVRSSSSATRQIEAEPATSNQEPRTSNLEHRTSNLEPL